MTLLAAPNRSICQEFAAQPIIMSGCERQLERRYRRSGQLGVPLRRGDQVCGRRPAVGVGDHGQLTGAAERHELRVIMWPADGGVAVAWLTNHQGPAPSWGDFIEYVLGHLQEPRIGGQYYGAVVVVAVFRMGANDPAGDLAEGKLGQDVGGVDEHAEAADIDALADHPHG